MTIEKIQNCSECGKNLYTGYPVMCAPCMSRFCDKKSEDKKIEKVKNEAGKIKYCRDCNYIVNKKATLKLLKGRRKNVVSEKTK
jgi:hypothetical protein